MATKKQKKISKARGTRKSTMTNKRKAANASDAVMAQFKRIWVVVFIALSFLWLSGWYVLSDGPARTSSWLQGHAINISASSGFKVKNILVEGRVYTDAEMLLALINVREGDPLFVFDPSEAKRQIEKIGWVKKAHVQRRFPDTIYINLTEKKPVALWYKYGALSLVDSDGTLITNKNLDQFKNLIMVKGRNAPDKVSPFIEMISKVHGFSEKIDHAEWIDNRRWNLVLTDDKRIKLPENDALGAIQHIMHREQQDGILSKNAIVEIDARYKDRLIVRTKLGTVQDYKANIQKVGMEL